ncbi:hypothetical protein GWK47_039476 [Chionoecetes opilio]|uniref:Secreted protein n=1 Tax=Chionoecetes opilio TaxID=41210 RepID=A0A8J4YK39_CHIOP|nr:hypothetical protein GWK47_039476 [Chionoecetes opilio]
MFEINLALVFVGNLCLFGLPDPHLLDRSELCRLLAPHLTTRILPVNKKVLATLWLLGNQESGQCQALLLRVLVSQQCQALLLLQQEPCQDQQLYKERYILAKKKCPTL